ncbi:Spy/CpxP family protein refolding chaperone [Lysobacter xanthus]
MTANTSRPSSSIHRGAAVTRTLALAVALCAGGAITYAATAPSALAATVTAGIDGTPWFPHGHRHAALHEHFEQVLRDAGASDAQRQAIDGIIKETMVAEHGDMARYHAGLGAMKSLLAAPAIDVAAVERVRAQQDQVLLDSDRRITEALLRIAKVLTPAQRRALSVEIDGMMASHAGHHAGH